MCDYKTFRKWLIIIPFCVLHVFGSPSIISNLLVYHIFSKDSVKNNIFGGLNLCDEDDSCKNDLDKSELSKKLYMDGFYTENSCNHFLKNFVDRVKRHKNNLSKNEVVVCDNRIDKIDKKFSELICSRDFVSDEKPWVAFA